ncbi:MAG: glycerol-3-phosphate dehydrogenase subunit GlpB [Chloroflexi bacterium]|nr:glycerol-3-phosphate dehydrogenase subunit GlpB [Chloroflexota bacterium]
MLDLLIIGAGLSGLMAAYAAAQKDLRVRVVSKGLGALHWSAGTIDALGCVPGESEMVRRPRERLPDLPADHPYRLLGEDAVFSALSEFATLAENMGLPYVGAAAEGENLRLPSPAGAPRPVFLAPAGQIAGDLSRDDPMLIVGFRGLRDFYPALIADNLRKQGHAARAAFLPLSLITERRDFTTVHLAQALDDPARRRELGRALKKLVEPGERVGLPAILGLDDHPAVLAELQDILEAEVFEIPTLPPSVPGIRLYRALRDRVESLGARVEAGMEVIGFQAEKGRVLWVETETAARPLRHRAENFLLATGGILGGGIDSGHAGRVWETIFDLPLTLPQQRSQWFRPRFLDPDGHPIFRGGVRVDASWRPIHESGEPVYENLRAAGSILAGFDPFAERSKEGVDIATGLAAFARSH